MKSIPIQISTPAAPTTRAATPEAGNDRTPDQAFSSQLRAAEPRKESEQQSASAEASVAPADPARSSESAEEEGETSPVAEKGDESEALGKGTADSAEPGISRAAERMDEKVVALDPEQISEMQINQAVLPAQTPLATQQALAWQNQGFTPEALPAAVRMASSLQPGGAQGQPALQTLLAQSMQGEGAGPEGTGIRLGLGSLQPVLTEAANGERGALLSTALQSAAAPTFTNAAATAFTPLLNAAQIPTWAQVPVPVAHPNFSAQMADQLLLMTTRGVQTAQILLNPAELGPLEVKIQVRQDQAQVQIQAQVPMVREMVESSAQRLRDLLADQGLNLTQFDVNPRNGGQSHEQAGQGRSAHTDVAEGDVQPADSAQVVSVVHPDRLIDDYA